MMRYFWLDCEVYTHNMSNACMSGFTTPRVRSFSVRFWRFGLKSGQNRARLMSHTAALRRHSMPAVPTRPGLIGCAGASSTWQLCASETSPGEPPRAQAGLREPATQRAL